jgi:hypothetical protein
MRQCGCGRFTHFLVIRHDLWPSYPPQFFASCLKLFLARSLGVLSLTLPLGSYPHNPPSIQSELFYTDAEKKAAQSHKRRAPPPAPRCPCVASVPRPRLIPIMAGVFFLHAERPRDIVNRVTRLGFWEVFHLTPERAQARYFASPVRCRRRRSHARNEHADRWQIHHRAQRLRLRGSASGVPAVKCELPVL